MIVQHKLGIWHFLTTLAFISQLSQCQITTITDQLKFGVLKSCLILDGIPPTRIVARDNPLQDSQYEILNFQWDTLHGQITPLAYLVASSPSHISTAIRCSKLSGIRIVPRSGGHSYMKLGYGDEHALIVDLHLMNNVKLVKNSDGDTLVQTGAGALSGRIQYRVWSQSNGTRLALAPTCPTVGVAGFAQGGGFDAYHSRQFGIGSDNVVEMQMVDWTGTLLTINNRTNTDLFWALRGGGGGNFGIVTSFTFKTYPALGQIAFAVVTFAWNDFIPFFKAWQSFIVPDPDGQVGTVLIFTAQNITMKVWSTRSGGNGGQVEVENILATFPTPADLTMKLYTPVEQMLYVARTNGDETLPNFAALDNLTHVGQEKIGWKKVKSFYVNQILTSDADIAQLQVLLQQSLIPTTTAINVEHYGAASNAFGPSDTAFIHRNGTLYSAQLAVFAPNGQEDNVAVDGMKTLFEATKQLLGHTQSYQNYLDEDLSDWLQRYYGSNLERLVAVKKKVDPFNIFRSPRSIPLTLP